MERKFMIQKTGTSDTKHLNFRQGLYVKEILWLFLQVQRWESVVQARTFWAVFDTSIDSLSFRHHFSHPGKTWVESFNLLDDHHGMAKILQTLKFDTNSRVGTSRKRSTRAIRRNLPSFPLYFWVFQAGNWAFKSDQEDLFIHCPLSDIYIISARWPAYAGHKGKIRLEITRRGMVGLDMISCQPSDSPFLFFSSLRLFRWWISLKRPILGEHWAV